MSADTPLLSLGESTAEAVERALQNAYPGAARVGAVVAGHGAEEGGEQAVHDQEGDVLDRQGQQERARSSMLFASAAGAPTLVTCHLSQVTWRRQSRGHRGL